MNKRTPLYDEHVRAGARIVPFAGYEMPIQYAGTVKEHTAVRTGMGLFDLSHMGEFRIDGPDALEAVDRLVTNDIRSLQVWQIKYTPMTYPDGGIVDDLLVYRYPDHLMLVVNAANIAKDLTWIEEHLEGDAYVTDESDSTALLAVQGPKAERFLQPLTTVNLAEIAYYHFCTAPLLDVEMTISRTGYTGEDGFELYMPGADAPRVWRELLQRGRPDGLVPVGLAARDTLRLEAGLMLYGNDIDRSTSPLEAGLGWTVKFTDHPFMGREVLERQKAAGVGRRMVAIEMLDRAIPRAGYAIVRDGRQIGVLTSGTFSPTLGHGIGLGYVESGNARPGTEVEVLVRGQSHPARIARRPLYKREGS